MGAEAKLRDLGIDLPAPPKPFASYRAAVRSGNILFIAGTGPTRDGQIIMQGKLGEKVSVEDGYEAARLSVLNSLSAARAALGTLDAIRQVAKATVYVACGPGFQDHPKVADGATDLLRDLFGEPGLPARAAVGVASLPMDIPVEVEVAFEVEG